MKIFVASNGTSVAERLGKCREFTIYEIENRKIINKEIVKNPGHNASEIAGFLLANECDILCVGGLGDSALRMLSTHGVAIGVDAKGECDTLINNLITDEDFNFEAYASHGHCHDHDCCCGGHHEDDCCCGHHHEGECCEGDECECSCEEEHEEHHCCCGHHHE